VSDKGIKYDSQKPDISLIPTVALLDEAALWTKGKLKYSAYNWHKGLTFSRVLSAIGRHWALLNAGIDLDEETKCLHTSAIRCGAGMLSQFIVEGRTELDDRLKLDEATKAKVQALSQGEMVWDLLNDEELKRERMELQLESLQRQYSEDGHIDAELASGSCETAGQERRRPMVSESLGLPDWNLDEMLTTAFAKQK